MSDIKTRETVKNIKTIDRSASLGEKMKKAAIRTKRSVTNLSDDRQGSPGEYAGEQVEFAAKDLIHDTAQYAGDKTKKAVDRGRDAFREHRKAKRREQQDQKSQNSGQQQNSANSASRTSGSNGSAPSGGVQGQPKGQTTRGGQQSGNANHAGQPGARTSGTQNSARPAKKTTSAPKSQSPSRAAQQTSKTARSGARSAKRTTQTAQRTAKATKQTAKTTQQTVRTASRTIKQTAKSTGKTAAKTAKGTIKTAQRTIKTAKQTSKVAIKTTKAVAKTAQRTAQATVKTAKAAAAAARAAAQAAAATAKVVAKAVVAAVKATIAAIQALVAAIAAGGWVAVLAVVIICLIALIVGSCFGIFFADEVDENSLSVAVSEIDESYDNLLTNIVLSGEYDAVEASGSRADWKEVLAVYAVKTTTDAEVGQDVATMTDEKKQLLRNIFWAMNSVSYYSETVQVAETVEALDEEGNPIEVEVEVDYTTLYISISSKTADEIANEYGFTDDQKAQLEELLAEENAGLWEGVIQ